MAPPPVPGHARLKRIPRLASVLLAWCCASILSLAHTAPAQGVPGGPFVLPAMPQVQPAQVAPAESLRFLQTQGQQQLFQQQQQQAHTEAHQGTVAEMFRLPGPGALPSPAAQNAIQEQQTAQAEALSVMAAQALNEDLLGGATGEQGTVPDLPYPAMFQQAPSAPLGAESPRFVDLDIARRRQAELSSHSLADIIASAQNAANQVATAAQQHVQQQQQQQLEEQQRQEQQRQEQQRQEQLRQQQLLQQQQQQQQLQQQQLLLQQQRQQQLERERLLNPAATQGLLQSSLQKQLSQAQSLLDVEQESYNEDSLWAKGLLEKKGIDTSKNAPRAKDRSRRRHHHHRDDDDDDDYDEDDYDDEEDERDRRQSNELLPSTQEELPRDVRSLFEEANKRYEHEAPVQMADPPPSLLAISSDAQPADDNGDNDEDDDEEEEASLLQSGMSASHTGGTELDRQIKQAQNLLLREAAQVEQEKTWARNVYQFEYSKVIDDLKNRKKRTEKLEQLLAGLKKAKMQVLVQKNLNEVTHVLGMLGKKTPEASPSSKSELNQYEAINEKILGMKGQLSQMTSSGTVKDVNRLSSQLTKDFGDEPFNPGTNNLQSGMLGAVETYSAMEPAAGGQGETMLERRLAPQVGSLLGTYQSSLDAETPGILAPQSPQSLLTASASVSPDPGAASAMFGVPGPLDSPVPIIGPPPPLGNNDGSIADAELVADGSLPTLPPVTPLSAIPSLPGAVQQLQQPVGLVQSGSSTDVSPVVPVLSEEAATPAALEVSSPTITPTAAAATTSSDSSAADSAADEAGSQMQKMISSMQERVANFANSLKPFVPAAGASERPEEGGEGVKRERAEQAHGHSSSRHQVRHLPHEPRERENPAILKIQKMKKMIAEKLARAREEAAKIGESETAQSNADKHAKTK